MESMLTFKFYPQEFLMYLPYAGMSLEKTGQLLRDILEACIKKDKEFLEQFPFVGKITEIRTDDEDNLHCLYRSCNSKKSAKEEEEK